MYKLIISAAALGFAVVQPVAAQAQDSGVYVVAIPTSDLNVASPAGAEALRGRVMYAARETCGDSQRLEDLFEQNACIANFMRAADTRIASASARPGPHLASR